MLFAAIAVCKTAKQTPKKSAFGRGFLAAIAIAGVSVAVVWGTGLINDALEPGAGAGEAICAAPWIIVALCCKRIVIGRVSRMRK